jgi:hypothetical protein
VLKVQPRRVDPVGVLMRGDHVADAVPRGTRAVDDAPEWPERRELPVPVLLRVREPERVARLLPQREREQDEDERSRRDPRERPTARVPRGTASAT